MNNDVTRPPTLPTQPPKDTPTTAFAGGLAAEDPMRNFGYTVAAYAVLWAILLVFVFLSWRRQAALEARLGELESALGRANKSPRQPS